MFKFTYPDMQQVHSTLIRLKKDYRLSNNDIAAALKTSVTNVSNWMNLKNGISPKFKDAIEDYIAETWQPALMFVSSTENYPGGTFLNCGSRYDPFFTWIHHYTPETEEAEIGMLEELEKAVEKGEAKLYLVELYNDMDDANVRGRKDERLYTIGTAFHTEDTNVHFTGNGKVEILKSKVFDYEHATPIKTK